MAFEIFELETKMDNRDNLKITIITVCLNAARTIENTITSVISQSYPCIEYIIVDGQSTDGTQGIINKYRDRISAYISEKDAGIYDAMNKGISMATGDFIYFLGGDDVLAGDIIKDVVPYLNSDVNSVHYGQVLLNPSRKLFGGKFSKWRLIHKNITHQSIFYPAIVFEIKRFDTKYPVAADWDFNLYLMSKNVRFEYNGLIIAVFNTNGISSKGDREFYQNRKMIVKEYFGIVEWLYLTLFILTPINILNYVITRYRRMTTDLKR